MTISDRECDCLRQRHLDRRAEEQRRAARLDRAAQVAVAIGPALLLLAIGAFVLAVTGESCDGSAFAHSGEGPHRAEPSPAVVLDASTAPTLTPAGELETRMRAWQPLWRDRRPGELAEVAIAIVSGCAAAPWPSPERCVALVTALAFRESSWRADAIGARGEISIMQIHGAALAGETREAAAAPARNVELGLRWLAASAEQCRIAGWSGRPDFTERVLSRYAGLSCIPSRGARLVLRWESAL